MSKTELIEMIEGLRSQMNKLASDGAEYSAVLRISQELDELIVRYHRICI